MSDDKKPDNLHFIPLHGGDKLTVQLGVKEVRAAILEYIERKHGTIADADVQVQVRGTNVRATALVRGWVKPGPVK